jgi:hypothetical protein
MGVEYRHFVIPATCGLIPSPARVCNLVQKLVERRWLVDGPAELETPGRVQTVPGLLDENQYVALMASDFRLSWQMKWPGEAPYAFTNQAFEDAYYTVQVCHSPQFLCPLSDLILPLQDPVDNATEARPEGLLSRVKGLFGSRSTPLLDLAIRCECGASLEDRSEVFEAYTLLLARCPSCGKAFRPESRRGKLRNGWTGSANRRLGGLVHRFGVVFDCGKSLPDESGPGVLNPMLSELISNCMGTSLFEFGDLY